MYLNNSVLRQMLSNYRDYNNWVDQYAHYAAQLTFVV